MFVTNAVLDGRFLLRACIVNFRTTRRRHGRRSPRSWRAPAGSSTPSCVPGGTIRTDTIYRAALPFAVAYMKQPLKLDYLWAALCILGAVYFGFRTPARQ